MKRLLEDQTGNKEKDDKIHPIMSGNIDKLWAFDKV